MSGKCPGMDPANWKFEDINEYLCPGCGNPIEFWKDDIRLKCPKCGRVNDNPKNESSCFSWCKKADECLGSQYQEIKKK